MLKHFSILNIVLGVLLTGCDRAVDSGDPLVRDPLVGKWEDSRGKSWEYFSDGTVLMSEKGKETNFIGHWNRLADGRVKIEFTMLGNSVGEVFTEESKGDGLLFTDSKGQENNWKSVQ